MKHISKDLLVFLNNLEPLVDKIFLLLIQLPPFLTESKRVLKHYKEWQINWIVDSNML
jgi:hypothetical protein